MLTHDPSADVALPKTRLAQSVADQHNQNMAALDKLGLDSSVFEVCGVIGEPLEDETDLVDVEDDDGEYSQMPLNFVVNFFDCDGDEHEDKKKAEDEEANNVVKKMLAENKELLDRFEAVHGLFLIGEQ